MPQMRRFFAGLSGFRVSSFLSGLTADRGGAIFIMFALLLPVILGFIGLGVEVAFWYQAKRGLQTAADAAAIAGAYEVWDGNSESAAYTAALREAERNWSATFDSSEFDNDIMPPTSGSYSGDSSAVEVELSKSVNLMFLGYLMSTSSVTINARAVGTLGTKSTACVLSLSESSSATTFSISGNATVDMSGCSVAVNGAATSADGGSDALTVSGATTNLTAECYNVVGGVSGAEDITTSCSTPGTGGHAVTDPYAYDASDDPLPEPDPDDLSVKCASSPCTYSDTTIDPGIYDGITLQGNITMNPGVYYIKGHNFRVNANANVIGSDVTIFLTSDDAGTTWPSVSVIGNSEMDLTAPTTGDQAGVVFYQDRDTPTSENTTASFLGGSDMELEGALYFPAADLSYSGGSLFDSECIQIVAYEVSIAGDAYLDNNCAMLSGSSNAINIQELTLVE